MIVKDRETIIVAVANHKGGVGKTLCSVNLAHYMLDHYQKVLVIDFDSQRNTSKWMCKHLDKLAFKMPDIFKFCVQHDINEPDAKEQLKTMINSAKVISFENKKEISLMPSSLKLDVVSMELTVNDDLARFKIVKLIHAMAEGYDMVFIDTPPSIDMLTRTAISAADYILIPVGIDPDAIEGALDIKNIIMPKAKEYFNPNLRIIGIVISGRDRYNLSKAIEQMAVEQFGNLVFRSQISKTNRVGEAKTLQKSIRDLSGNKNFEKIHKEFLQLSLEFHKRFKNDDGGRK